METAIISVIGTILAAFLAWFGVRMANALKRDELDVRRQELFRDSLEFLTGGTQKRTVGIFTLERFVRQDPRIKETAAAILYGQILHVKFPMDDVKAKSDADRQIEKYNLFQMEQLLTAWGYESPVEDGYVLTKSVRPN